MNGQYAVVVGRIRQELHELERVVARAQRAIAVARRHPEDQDLYLDSAALNLHDFYGGIERILHQIAVSVDGSVPAGREWHRELLRQMSIALPRVRPRVLSTETVQALSEYLGFRHVVRNIYTFQFDPERIERLVVELAPTFSQVRTELEAFARVLEQIASADRD
jgi:hypothetical protein